MSAALELLEERFAGDLAELAQLVRDCDPRFEAAARSLQNRATVELPPELRALNCVSVQIHFGPEGPTTGLSLWPFEPAGKALN